MTTKSPAPLPLPLLDTLLHLTPLDVLLFDTELVCRYAAPAGGALFGRTTAELVGTPADEIFPPVSGDLHTALRLAAESAATYQYPAYRYTHGDATTRTLFCWSVRIESIILHDYRGREEFHGVLVTLADVQDLADQTDQLRQETDRLQLENDRLRHRLADAERREASAAGARRELNAGVREALAPAVGYLQLLSRRPDALPGQPAADVIEQSVLPSLRRVVEVLGEGDILPPV